MSETTHLPPSRRPRVAQRNQPVPLAVEPGALIRPHEMDVVTRFLGGEGRVPAFVAVYGSTGQHKDVQRAGAFYGRPEIAATIAAATAAGLRSGLESRETFVADQHALIQEARLAGQYGPVMSGRATLARVLGIDQGAVVSPLRGTTDQDLILQLRVALGPAAAAAAERELLGGDDTTA